MMEKTLTHSKTSEKNPWPVTENHLSSRDGKHSSEWSSWECSEGKKDIQKDIIKDTEVHTLASSVHEPRGRGRLGKSSRDRGWNGSSKRHSELSRKNSWNVTKDHSSSRDSRSRRYSDRDARDSPNDDTVDREVDTVSNHTFNEQWGRSKIRKRRRSSQSRFSHQGYRKSRDRDHPRSELTEGSKFRADDRVALPSDDYKGSGRKENEKKSEKALWGTNAGVSEKPMDTRPAKPENNIGNSYSHGPGREEDKIKSKKDSLWDKLAGLSEKPTDTPGWGTWPAKHENYIGNSDSHDSRSKLWDGRWVKKQIDNNNISDSVKKSGERNDSGSSEKLSKGDTFMTLNMPVDREKVMDQGKDKTKSWSGPTCDRDCSLDRQEAKLSGWEDNTKISENGSIWDKFADVSERPKDTTCQDNWTALPDSSSWNSNHHKPQSIRRDGRSEGRVYSQDLINAKKQGDNNSFYNPVKKSSERADAGWNEKFFETKESLQSHLHNDAANSTNMDLMTLGNKEKAKGDKAIGNRDPRIRGDVEERNDGNMSYNLVQKDIQNVGSEWNKKVNIRGANRFSTLQSDYNGSGTSTNKVSDLVRLNDGKKSTNQREDKKNSWSPCDDSAFSLDNTKASGWGDSKSLNDRRCHDLIDVEKPSQNNLVKTYWEMDQFEEALKILETWARQNSISTDQALRLGKLQAYLSLISENGQQNTPGNTTVVHPKSNEVRRKLKMEYLESSAAISKQQEPVGYTELNQKTVMVEEVNGNYSKGEQCKKEEEIIQSVGVDARCEAGESKLDDSSTWLFKNALVKLVKEIVKPIWMEGQIKKEVHNIIVKKAVDKVITAEGANIPRTQEHIEKYLSFSEPRISALINGYVAHFKKLADESS